MFELDQRIAEQLTEVSLNSSIQVRCGNSNAFMVTASTMIPLMQMFEMGGVYICATRGAVEIIEAFEAIGVDVSNIQFVDLVSSGILGGTAAILFIYSYRLISASKMASFEYFGIPSSFVLGWLFFNEAPWEQLFPGVFVIVFAGMIIIWRDKVKQKKTKVSREIN